MIDFEKLLFFDIKRISEKASQSRTRLLVSKIIEESHTTKDTQASKMTSIQLSFLVVLVVAALASTVHGFSNMNGHGSAIRKSSSLYMTVLSYNGKKKNFKAGSPLSKALPALGIKPRYSCKK